MRTAVRLLVASALLAPVACGNGGDDGTHVVALLRAVPTGNNAPILDELADAGFVQGENLSLLPDDPEGTAYPTEEEARDAVRAWVEEGVDLIFAFSSTGAAVAEEHAPGVPVIFLVNDPRAVGLVEHESAPEGHLTGVTFRAPADRTLDLARRAVPDLTTVGLLSPGSDPAARPHREAVTAAAAELGIEVVSQAFAGETDVASAVGMLAEAGVDAVVVVNAPTAVRVAPAIVAAASERGLPLVANTALVEGAVVVLEPDTDALLAQMGRQGARILDGAAVEDVPVEDPVRYRVVLDAGQASELGLPELSPALLRQADEVLR